jgi:ribosomal biogenesis protein LAS1
MTLALIRFVNSLLDPIQKKDKSLPLSVLAVTAGLPTVFVEVRHWGTHESNLPGMEVLRDMGIRALEWLWHNYWNKPEESVELLPLSKGDDAQAVDLVSQFRQRREEDFERLMVKLGQDENLDESRKIWEPLITFLSKELPMFMEDVIEYIVDSMIATPSCKDRYLHD